MPTGVLGLEEVWSAPEGSLLLLCAESGIERQLLAGWASGQLSADGSPVACAEVDRDGDNLAELLSARADPLLVPVGVLWPSGEQWGGRLPFGLASVVRARRAAVPSPLPKAEILVGTPARLSQLRSRAAARPEIALADFVRLQSWLTLEHDERAVHGDRYKVPRLVAEDIRSGPRFPAVVSRLAEELDRPREEIIAEAGGALAEMVASESPIAVDAWHRIGNFVARAYDVNADTAPLAQLRERNRDVALAFLPNHRSYMDPLVLRSVLARQGWPPNRVLGGNNLSFWPLGTIARRSGIVFIRRSFRDAPVYKAMLREYLAYLLSKRFNIEWYLEGGRTRTGKLRSPRYGLLRYVVDGLESGDVRDVVLVPVSIVYDAQSEVGAIAAEERGADKQPEGIRWLLGYLGTRVRARSAVHIRFGEPLALRQSLEQGRSDDQQGVFSDVDVAKVAFEVCHRINDATPITPTALITLALLGAQGRALTLGEVQAVVDPLLDYVAQRRLPTTAGLSRRGSAGLATALRDLSGSGLVTRYAAGTEPVYCIAVDKHLEAAFYRNTLVHFFVTRSIVEVALVATARDGGADLDRLAWDHALRLRDLLKFEFFFPTKAVFAGLVRAEVQLIDPLWRDRRRDPQEIRRVLGAARPLFAPLVLQPFLEAYALVAERLAADRSPRGSSERALLDECGRVARQRVLQQKVRSPESNSRELFRGALRLAGNRGLFDPAGQLEEEVSRQGRVALAAELADAVQCCIEVAQLGDA